ncbi:MULTISPECIES: type II toxin-antitoxin system HicB family antitoxin [unclassified Bradyrhizobium]|uniref:type II toxin-antitoxin system HicB family antitoxin n=1 Tax=unclassified Bradyrhizobium TaxID=2631580 RepID=UPI0028EB3F40|nr:MULTISPECIES: type II toxin-antitoxin system HicB family antitoxin [unclassified Bradyrhizobium]
MTDEITYSIVIAKLEPEDGSGFIAYVPDLQGCMSDGETQEEALTNVSQAIKEWIDAAKRHDRPIPEPGSAARNQKINREQISAKIAEQQKAFEQLNADIREVKRNIEDFKERLVNDPAGWAPEFVLVAAKQNHSEDIFH